MKHPANICKRWWHKVTNALETSRNRAPMLATTQPPTLTHPCPHMPIPKMPTHVAQKSACTLHTLTRACMHVHKHTGGSTSQVLPNWNKPFGQASTIAIARPRQSRTWGFSVIQYLHANHQWQMNEKKMRKIQKKSQTTQSLKYVWTLQKIAAHPRLFRRFSASIRTASGTKNKETQPSNELHKARYSHPGCVWLVECACRCSSPACLHFMRWELCTWCFWPSNHCFWVFPLSVCIHTHTHPSGIPYDGGHQDTPSLTSHIHHREVCRLPPPRPKSNSKTSPKDLPKWMPMHNLLIKTVTNNLLHHTIQIWWPMSIIKSELAQEHTKFWKAVSLDSRSHLVLCLVLIPRLQSSSLTVKKNDKDLHQRFYQTQNGSGAPPSVCSNMIWQAHPCPGKLGGHLGRKFQWPSRRLEQQCRTWEFRLTSKACQPALSFLSFILCSLQAVGVC